MPHHNHSIRRRRAAAFAGSCCVALLLLLGVQFLSPHPAHDLHSSASLPPEGDTAAHKQPNVTGGRRWQHQVQWLTGSLRQPHSNSSSATRQRPVATAPPAPPPAALSQHHHQQQPPAPQHAPHPQPAPAPPRLPPGVHPPATQHTTTTTTPTPVTRYVSAAEGLRLTASYSQALSALSAALTQARQRAEEVTALKIELDALRRQQQQQQHPNKHDEANQQPQQGLLGSQQQPLLGQQNKQQLLLQPVQQQQQHADIVGSVSAAVDRRVHINVTAVAGGSSTIVARPPSYPPIPADAPDVAEHKKQQQQQRNHVRMFIGVYTGVNLTPLNASEQRYNYTARRAMLRATWFPGNPQDRHRLESQHGIILRFVVGSVQDPQQAAALDAEQQQHGDILRLPLQEGYSSLPNKTRTFFKVVTDNWEPDWILKMDDDVYLNPLRLLAASRQWDRMNNGAGVQYVGCMKHGYPWRQPGTRWYEPQHLLVGYTYWLHAYGSLYAIAGPVARNVIGRNWAQLRLLANEDTSVGLWLLASNVTHFEDMRLCSPRCTPASVGVLRNECAGLCDPLAELPALHANTTCSAPPGPLLRYHASHPEHKAFESMWVP